MSVVEAKGSRKMNIYEIEVKRADGELQTLAEFSGRVLLIVNTASKCGFTGQYEGLQKLHEKYAAAGLAVLGFPCNQFLGQEPGSDAEIQQFCSLNYHVAFPVFAKIEVNGPNTHPLFVLLKREAGGLLGSGIKWNFTKFLVDRRGKVRERYAPVTAPEKLEADIERLLAEPGI